MKNTFLILILLVAGLSSIGQQKQTSALFRNHAEYVHYLLDHPDLLVNEANDGQRAFTGYSRKLDSVIGSDNFDWTRWKNEYSYGTLIGDNGEEQYSELLRTETSYLWNNEAWEPNVMTESLKEGSDTQTVISKWDGEQWEYQSRVTCHYETLNGELMLSEVISELFTDSVWVLNARSEYEYDSLYRLSLNQNYVYDEEVEGGWRTNNKYDYTYNDDGALVTKLYSTIRNGNWRESSMDTLSYDENHQCVELLSRTKGGFGPGTNQWRDVSKYVFTYADGLPESEFYYAAGWFGPEMSLDNKTEYDFDARGNLLRKTSSIFNGQDWIVRDIYENEIDPSFEAANVLGLMPLWESTLNRGMGYVLGFSMPLQNQWRSCNIVSTNLDTQFELYCSGFTAVEETRPVSLKTYASAGKLVVESDSLTDIVVYDLLGRVVASKSHTSFASFSLRPGLYLVANGNDVVKITLP